MISAHVSHEQRQVDSERLIERYVLPRLHTLSTPAFIMLDQVFDKNLEEYLGFAKRVGLELLFSAKPCTLDYVVRKMARGVAGIDVSSLSEARLVREFLGEGDRTPLHFSSPSLSLDNWQAVARTCDYVNVNSLTSLARLAPLWDRSVRLGLRVNPGISSAKDRRYDPARPGSKLGVAAELFAKWATTAQPTPLSGIHFHTLCEACDFSATAASLAWLSTAAGPLLSQLSYINLGGGWSRPSLMHNAEALSEAITKLERRTSVTVFTEPGNGLTRDAGLLMTRVIDVFETGAMPVAVVDTTVAHAPETYEYQWSPDIYAPDNPHQPDGFAYEVAGASCLSGDVFGTYRFKRRLEVGDPLFIHQLGAYALPKASAFNGLLVPGIYRVLPSGDVITARGDTFSSYRDSWSTHDSAQP